jgi:sialate O-acetylesterase
MPSCGAIVRLRTFRDVTGELSIRGGNPSGFELCGATQASCRWAEAHVQGSSVVLRNALSAGNTTRVRYAWGESPVYSLNDDSGLPAGPFEVRVR